MNQPVRLDHFVALSSLSLLLACSGSGSNDTASVAGAAGTAAAIETSPTLGGAASVGGATSALVGGTLSATSGTTTGAASAGGATGGSNASSTGTMTAGGVTSTTGGASGTIAGGTSVGGAAGAVTNTVTSLTKDGITWTFSAPVVAGQFVTGDYFVLGPVTISAISPAPTSADPYLNGSVANLPTTNGKSGFDSRLNDGSDESWWFDATLRLYPPILLHPGDALVSSVSLATPHTVPEVMRSGDMSISPVASYSVLSVLAAAPPADAFRPSYCDRTQTIRRAVSVQRNLLPSLAPPKPAMTPTLAQFADWLRRPWIDTNAFLFDAPAEYMPSYGAQVAAAVGFASLTLMLNQPAADKVNLTNDLVQYGIDLFGCVQAGYGWPAFGGHRSGRKLPILLAGLLLGDDTMKNVSTSYPDEFGEDMQTVHISQIPGGYTTAWQGATVIYGGHYGVHADGTPASADLLYGPYEQLQPAQWPLLNSNEQLGEAYRRCCTSLVWIGEALAIHLLGAEGVWNHPAFFDYADRWMNEDDTQAVAAILAQSGFDYSADWERQRQTAGYFQGEFPQYTFVDDMWAAYR